MADGEPTNPNKVVAPGSDNTQGAAGGSVVSGGTKGSGGLDSGMSKVIEEQLAQQEKQTKQLENLARAIAKYQKVIDAANQDALKAKKAGDSKANEAAEKLLAALTSARDKQLGKFNTIGEDVAKLQEKVNENLAVIADDAGVSVAVARQHLKATTDYNREAKGRGDWVNKTLKAALDQTELVKTEESKLVTQTNSAMLDFSKSHGISLNAIANSQDVLNEMLDKVEGLDKTDPEAIRLAKEQIIQSKEFKEEMIKKSIEQRTEIERGNKDAEILEDLTKQNMKFGIVSEKTAQEMAKKQLDNEKKLRIQQHNEDIKITKEISSGVLKQATLSEQSARKLDQEAKQRKQNPFFGIEKKLGVGFAMVEDFIDAWKSGGWAKKVFLVLFFISGVIVGLAGSIFNKIKSLFTNAKWLQPVIGLITSTINSIKGFLSGSKIFAPIMNAVKPVIEIFTKAGSFISSVFTKIKPFIEMAKTLIGFGSKVTGLTSYIAPLINAFKMGSKFGAILGKAFWPIGVALTIIDGVIGAFKGFKKDGLMGIIPGILAQIVSSLTFGLVKFDFLYKVFKFVTDIYFLPIRLFIKVIKFYWQGIMALWDFVKDIFSGKGFKESLSKFVTKIFDGAKNLLNTVYDMTIGAVLGMFGFGKKKSEESKKDGEGILSKVFNVLKYLNPLYWIYKGVEAIIKLAASLYEKIKGFLPGLLAKIIKKVGEIVLNLLEIVGFPVKVLAYYYKKVYQLVTTILDKVFDILKAIVMVPLTFIEKWYKLQQRVVSKLFEVAEAFLMIPLNFLKNLFKMINNMTSKVMKILQGIMMIPVNFMLRLQKAVLAFVDYLLSFLPNFIAKYFRPTETLVDVNGGGGKGKEAEKSLAKEQKSRDEAAAASGGNKSMTNVSTNTTVNNVRSGAQGQPALIAPQPARNTEPTVRTMQFSEQPAF